MSILDFLILAVAGVVMFTVICLLPRYFSDEAKAERRRRRSNQRIATKGKHMTVKFSVRTKKPRD